MMPLKIGEYVKFVQVIVDSQPKLEGSYKIMNIVPIKDIQVVELLKDGEDCAVKVAIDCVTRI